MVFGLVVLIHDGDTLNGISQEVGATTAYLEAINNVDPDNLHVGTFLAIGQEGGLTVRVRAGDTASEIASEAGITTAILQRDNPGVNFDDLQVGSDLLIFSPGP